MVVTLGRIANGRTEGSVGFSATIDLLIIRRLPSSWRALIRKNTTAPSEFRGDSLRFKLHTAIISSNERQVLRKLRDSEIPSKKRHFRRSVTRGARVQA